MRTTLQKGGGYAIIYIQGMCRIHVAAHCERIAKDREHVLESGPRLRERVQHGAAVDLS